MGFLFIGIFIICATFSATQMACAAGSREFTWATVPHAVAMFGFLLLAHGIACGVI